MTLAAANPFDVPNLLPSAMHDVITALADRQGMTDAEYAPRAEEVETLIRSFQPRDVIDMVLTGQFLMVNMLLASAMRGVADAPKQRNHASLVSMARLSLSQVVHLEKRGLRPYRAETADQPEQRRPPAVRATEPPHLPSIPPATVGEPINEADSWLDKPYEEWVLETPANIALQDERAVPRTADLEPPAEFTAQPEAQAQTDLPMMAEPDAPPEVAVLTETAGLAKPATAPVPPFQTDFRAPASEHAG